MAVGHQEREPLPTVEGSEADGGQTDLVLPADDLDLTVVGKAQGAAWLVV